MPTVKKRKLLFIIDTLGGGGAERILAVLLKGLDRNHYHITVASLYSNGFYEDTIREVADSVICMLPDISQMKGIKKFIKRRKKTLLTKWIPLKWVWKLYLPTDSDVEIAFLEGFATRLLAASPNRDSIKYAWVHCDIERFHWIKPWYRNYKHEQECFAACDKVIGVSDEVTAAVQRLYNLKNTCTIINPIDFKEIIEKSKHSLFISPKKQCALNLISIGRYTKQKGYLELLKAIDILKNKKIAVHLRLLGEGEERELYENFIQEKNLSEYIELTGFVNNPYPYIKQADLFVCSSIAEGYSTAITEALILGIPVISTDVPGIRRQLQNNRCGTIIGKSAKEIAQSILELIQQPELIQQWKINASTYVEDMKLADSMKKIINLLNIPKHLL